MARPVLWRRLMPMEPEPLSVPSTAEAGSRYVLHHRLGEGGMAEVHLGVLCGPHGFEKQVVVKLLHTLFSGLPLYAEMLLNEACLAAKLNHPNIVQVMELGNMDGRPFIAMEYVPGQDLHRLLVRAAKRHSSVPVGVSARIAADMLAGLHHAHTRGEPVLHRDVSLQNVIVSYSGNVKLVDFGIAKAIGSESELTQVGQWKGKLSYMSPEQVRQEPLDARTDIFSAGIVLWELLTGSRLFRRRSDHETMLAVCTAKVPAPSLLNPEVPPELDAVVLRALAGGREERFATAELMRHELEEIIWRRRWRASPLDLQSLVLGLFGAERASEQALPSPATAVAPEAAASVRPSSSADAPFYDDGPTRQQRTRPDTPRRVALPRVDDALAVDNIDPTLESVPELRRRGRALPVALFVAAMVLLIFSVLWSLRVPIPFFQDREHARPATLATRVPGS
jgi:serine/threonine-protein kinase